MDEQIVSLEGFDLINSPRWNKGTAFNEQERDIFSLHGLLPPHSGALDDQLERRLQALGNHPTPFSKYSFLRDLQDTNETLFYALIVRNVEQMLPLVYTPTVGEGCQRFSEIWRKPRGLFFSYPMLAPIMRSGCKAPSTLVGGTIAFAARNMTPLSTRLCKT